MFDNMRSDFHRHESSFFNPALWAMWNYRFGQWAFTLKFEPFIWLTGKIYGLNMFLILITSGIRMHREVTVGKDFHLIHSGNIHIHPATIFGDRCGVMHEVTFGTNMRAGAPIVGNDVFIGAGAKVLGKISIGNGATIAANSLVLIDVPANATAIGVPARIMKYTGKRTKKDFTKGTLKEFKEQH
ncbi:MAG: serine O-acetyltransferase [Desulforhopalus sp.]|jgi:serine O-acetyltransferase